MPRKRKRPLSRRRQLTPDDLSIPDIMCFIGGWSPPKTRRDFETSRWRTWPEYRRDWEDLRRYLMPHPESPRGWVTDSDDPAHFYHVPAGKRPFAWWRLDAPKPYRLVAGDVVPDDKEQVEILARLGLLEPWEREYLAKLEEGLDLCRAGKNER